VIIKLLDLLNEIILSLSVTIVKAKELYIDFNKFNKHIPFRCNFFFFFFQVNVSRDL
jgi:hypothetical protein